MRLYNSSFRSALFCLSSKHHFNTTVHRAPSSRGTLSTTSINGKVAAITGASAGIGRAIALRLAQDGLDVVALDLPSKQDDLNDLKRDIAALGRKCSVIIGDASKENDVMELVDSAVADLGGIDVMVANAGICQPNSILDEESLETLDRLYALNVRGVYLSYRYAALQMVKQGRGGRIIGASSVAGKQGKSYVSAYSASKFAVRGLTQCAASELGKYGITVNTYAPGVIDTDMFRRFLDFKDGGTLSYYATNPVGRVGLVDDVADLVSFLASDKSGYITGQSINVNGGMFFD